MTRRRKHPLAIFFDTRWKKLVGGATAVLALLATAQQVGVFNHVDTFAWSSDIKSIQIAQANIQRQQLQLEISFYQYQLNQANASLAQNQAAQYSYRVKRQPIPSVLIDQQVALQNSIADLQRRIAADEAALAK